MRFRYRIDKIVISGTAFFVSLSVCAFANIIHVPSDQQTIQEGLNTAGLGDTVQVADGIYYENIVWPGTDGIKLFGASMENCVIDGGGMASVIRFDSNSGVDSMTIVRGFTITNGNAHDQYPYETGGGIYIYAASPILEDLIIKGNSARDFGGGVYIWSTARPIIRYCEISGNSATEYGGLYCYGIGDVVVDHCTVADNSPGGLYFETSAQPYITNSVIAFNFDYDVALHGTSFVPTVVNIGFTDIRYPVQLIGYAQVNDLGGVISDDPLFVDLNNGDYHLLAGSPCIDSGDPTFPYDPDDTITDMGAYYFPQETPVADQPEVPGAFKISQNYPNPFNASTNVGFQIPVETSVSISIFNIEGQRVGFFDQGILQPGFHQLTIDGSDLASGTYFYRIRAGELVAVNKMVLLK